MLSRSLFGASSTIGVGSSMGIGSGIGSISGCMLSSIVAVATSSFTGSGTSITATGSGTKGVAVWEEEPSPFSKLISPSTLLNEPKFFNWKFAPLSSTIVISFTNFAMRALASSVSTPST